MKTRGIQIVMILVCGRQGVVAALFVQMQYKGEEHLLTK